MQLYAALLAGLIGTAYSAVVLKEESYIQLPDSNNNFRINSGTARESAYDDFTKLLYVIGHEASVIHIINVVDPSQPQVVTRSISQYGRPLDIELCRKGSQKQYLAVTFDAITSPAYDGHLVLYRLLGDKDEPLMPIDTQEPEMIVGAHPDNMKFDSNCDLLIISNEGIPAMYDGTFIDPIGSITIVQLSATVGSPRKATLDFTKYDNENELGPLLEKGVRYWMKQDPTDASKSIKFSQCVEPEYVAITSNNGAAFITLQENNAIARIDLQSNIITDIFSMGNKSWVPFGLDASDADGMTNLTTGRRIISLYQPDKIAFFEWNEVEYLVTTDEGKPSRIPVGNGLDPFQDYERAANLAWIGLDSELEDQLKDDTQLGRAIMSKDDGRNPLKTNVPTMFGGRGVSVMNPLAMDMREWESGQELEMYSLKFSEFTFNGDVSSYNITPAQERDSRSPWMGPEVSTVAVGDFDGSKVFVFGSGRNGVLYVYKIRDGGSKPNLELQSLHRAGDILGTWELLYAEKKMGDAIITDIKFANQAVPLVMVTSEASGSVSIYSLANEDRPLPQVKDVVGQI